MPGPRISRIITTDDPGFVVEIKVKGTYINPSNNKSITSRYMFIDDEEEQTFMDANPMYKKDPQFIDLDDLGMARGPNIPYQVKHQEEIGILNKEPKTRSSRQVVRQGSAKPSSRRSNRL